jgi:excinuclease ABC subunit A
VVQLHGLVGAGNTVVVVEHDMHVIAGSDRVIYVGPGARKAAAWSLPAPPAVVAVAAESRTAPYLARELA